MQISPLNACKVDWEQNLLDFYVESVAFWITIVINIASINQWQKIKSMAPVSIIATWE